MKDEPKTKKRNCFSKFKKCFKKKISTIQHQFKKKRNIKEKLRSIISDLITLKKIDQLNQYIEFLEEERIYHEDKGKLIKRQIKANFILRFWKILMSTFVVFVVYIYFIKIYFFKLLKGNKNDDSVIFRFTYSVINIMYFIDALISLIEYYILRTNFNKFLLLFIVPFRFFIAIPFPLGSNLSYLVIPKFLRFDYILLFCENFKKFLKNLIEIFIFNPFLIIIFSFLKSISKSMIILYIYTNFLASLMAYFEDNAKDVVDLDNFDSHFIESFYWMFTTFISIGYGDIVPIGLWEISITGFTMFFGIILFSKIVNDIRNFLLRLKSYRKNKEYETIKFNEFVFNLQKNAKRILPEKFKLAIYAHYLINQSLHPKNHLDKNVVEMTNDVRHHLYNEVYRFLNDTYSVFFKGCQKEFIYEIFSCLKTKLLQPKKILVNYNKPVKKLYFVLLGEVHMISRYSKHLFTFKDGSIIADWYFITNTLSPVIYKVHSSKFCVGYYLTKDDFDRISLKYKESANNFKLLSFFKKSYHDQYIKDIRCNSISPSYSDNLRKPSESVSIIEDDQTSNYGCFMLTNNSINKLKDEEFLNNKIIEYKGKIWDLELKILNHQMNEVDEIDSSNNLN